MKVETTLQDYFKRKNVLMTSSGSAAIYLALKSLDIPKPRVGIPTNTCFQVTTAIIAAGGVPVFMDVNYSNMLMDLASIKFKLIDVLIMTHTYGSVSSIFEIVESCKKQNIFLIEDFCPALGAKYGDHRVGHFGDVSIGSFGTGKIIDVGHGGVLLTDHNHIYEKAVRLTLNLPETSKYDDYIHSLGSAFTKTYNAFFVTNEKQKCSAFSQNIDYSKFAFTKFLPNAFNAFEKEFNELDRKIEERNRNAKVIQNLAQQLKQISFPSRSAGSVIWRENLLLPAESRNKILREALNASLPISSWFCSLNDYFPSYQADTPNSDRLSDEILNVWVYDVDDSYYEKLFGIITKHLMA